MPPKRLGSPLQPSLASFCPPSPPPDATESNQAVNSTTGEAAAMAALAETVAPGGLAASVCQPAATGISGRAKGCTRVECAHLPLLFRRPHRANKADIGLHMGCCPGYATVKGGCGHEPGCRNSKGVKPAERRRVFHPRPGVTHIFTAVTASNAGVPHGAPNHPGGDWYELHKGRSEADPGAKTFTTVPENDERGQLHIHTMLDVYMDFTLAQEAKLKDWLKTTVGMGPTPGLIEGKIQTKTMTNRPRLLRYLCEGSGS